MGTISKRIIGYLLTALILTGCVLPLCTVEAGEKPDYSISPDYAARYPQGVFSFYDAEVSVVEGDTVFLKLIRMGGTEGRVSVEIKAIDISAKFGVDYEARVEGRTFVPDDEYTGTLIENYLLESGGDYILSDSMLTDEVYRGIIGCSDDARMTDEQTAEFYGASVGLVADTFGISDEDAMKMIGLNDPDAAAVQTDAGTDPHYASALHEQKDAVLGEQTPANGMDNTDMFDMDSLIGNNDANLAASAVNAAAVGASFTVTFDSGENEKVIRVKAVDDDAYEPQELFTFGLCNPADGAELGEFINAAVVIEDNDEAEESAIGFESTSVTVSSGDTAAAVDILRSGCVNGYTEISVRTVSGSACEGEDYLPIDTTAVFLPGEERKTVLLPLKTSVSDHTEPKTIGIVLSCETNNTEVTAAEATVTIEPRQASNGVGIMPPEKEKTVDYSLYGEPIIIDLGAAKKQESSLGPIYCELATLFTSKNLNIEDSLYDAARVEIDLTRPRNVYSRQSMNDRYVYIAVNAVDPAYGELPYKSWSDKVIMFYDDSATLAMASNNDRPIFAKNDSLSICKNRYDYTLRHAYEFKGIYNFFYMDDRDFRMKWREIEIHEIRVYPSARQLLFDKRVYGKVLTEAPVTAEYRTFTGLDESSVVKTSTFDAGTVKLPEKAYRGWTVAEGEYTPSKEGEKRKMTQWGYTFTEPNGKFRSVTRRIGSVLTAADIESITNDNVVGYYTTPILRGDNVDYISVEKYDAGFGALTIGGKVYNGENVTSADWREGDELIVYVEPFFGYKCDEIEITRGSSVERVKPGEPVMLTKGMKIKPLLREEDICVTLRWDYPHIGEEIGYEVFRADYELTSDHPFTDNGDGTYTFEHMTPTDVVTVYALPKNTDSTGVTLRKDYLETLKPGDHTFTLVTDRGEATITLTVLASDDDGDDTPETYSVTGGLPAVWKQGASKGLTILAASDAETVQSVRVDGAKLAGSDYEAAKGFVRERTGYWVRTLSEGESKMSDDMRYVACVGDAYAFQVDNRDMTFEFYLIRKDPDASGALVQGRVVTNGGTIKRPSAVTVTADNYKTAGAPVAGATVSVLSNDPNDMLYTDGRYYYPSATTDKNGDFTVYLPAYASTGTGLGYCISITVNKQIYQNITAYSKGGITVFQVPYQNPNFQIDRMTLGSDLDTTEILLTDTDVKIGAHVVISEGYRAQRLVFRSYDSEGKLVKEWTAITSTAKGWDYESTFKPSDCLREGGRLTAELYDQYNRGQGEFDTGYRMKFVPKPMAFTLPQFDPQQSVTLPIIGDMTVAADFGAASSAQPTSDDPTSTTDIGSAGKESDKHYLEISFGASSAIKDAVKAAKKDDNYKSMSAQARASLILSNIKLDKSDSHTIYEHDFDKSDSGDDSGGSGQSGESSGDASGDASGDPGSGGEQSSGGSGGEQSSGSTSEEPAPGGETSAEESGPSGSGTASVRPAFDQQAPATDPGSGSEESGEGNQLEKPAKFKTGDGKNQMEFTYALGVYMSMYSQDGTLYFEDLTLYAKLGVEYAMTRQFYIYGVPVYLKFSGELYGEVLAHTDPIDGEPVKSNLVDIFNAQTQTTGVFHITFKISIGAGLGNPDFLSIGVSGTMTLEVDYQPWKDGAGTVTLSFDAEGSILAVKIKYNIAKACYGMFKTKNYTGTMDFSKVKNADKFKDPDDTGGTKKLLSYRDADSLTEIYGSYGQRARTSSLNGPDSVLVKSGENSADNRIVAEKTRTGVTDVVSPLLLPIKDGNAALYLRLDDDDTRENGDFSAVAYSVISPDGAETRPAYLDDDNTFDGDLTAAVIGDGRILVIWSDLDRSLGNGLPDDIGEALNHTDLSYCIFDKNGVPGEIRKLTNGAGCDRMPVIAYDESTGKTFIAYVATDYQTEGVTFGEDNLEGLGNFLYNSYSTVCFKVLDENGEIVTAYGEAEESYRLYEQEHGEGCLNGLRYLNTAVDDSPVQPTIDELTAAAVGGKVYIVYSLDTDRSTTTGEDRELCLVTCDPESMIQSDPVVITGDDSADVHPQLVAFGGSPLLFWNNDGRISCTDLTDYQGGIPDEDLPFMERLEPDVHTNAASSFFITVQPDGALCIVWTDWAESDGENGQTPAVFFREYDPDYRMPTGSDEESYLYGNWGNAQLLASAGADQDISEIAYLDLDDRIVIAYKLTNKDENSWIASYDSYLAVLKEGNSLDFGLTFEPVCPLPGEPAAFTVTVTNTGSLPTEKVTVKADLIGPDGKVTPIGTRSFTEHYQSNGVVAAAFDDFAYPEQPEGCMIRVTAWENDFRESAVVRQLPLPCDADISFADIELTPLGDGRHLLSADVENNGNKALDGLLLIGYGEPTGPKGARAFTDLAEPAALSVDFKDAAHAVMCFTVPDDLYDEDGVCRLSLVAIDDTGTVYAEQTIVLHEDKAESAVPADIRTNAENGELVLQKGDVASLEAAILPYAARSGYRIEYRTNDPSVAEIDDQGNLTARKAGETVVTVSVVKTESALFINSDCRGSTGDGRPVVIDENGWITALEDTEAGTAVLTKQIAVTVNAGAEDPAPGDSAPIFFWIALAMIVACCVVLLSVKAAKSGLWPEERL